AFQQQFGKPQLRAEVQRWLESQVMNVCAELYWSDPAVQELSSHVTRSRAAGLWADVSARVSQAAAAASSVVSALLAADTAKEQQGPRLGRAPDADTEARARGGPARAAGEWGEGDDVYWGHQLDRASALLTKSGVGRWTTQMVVDLLMGNVEAMVGDEPFAHHPDMRDAVLKFSNAILWSKYHSTVDQVENTIKPFKYEVEVEPHEWAKARKRSAMLLDGELRLCRQALQKIRATAPRKRLQQAVQFVRSAEKRGLDPAAIQAELARRNRDQAAAPAPETEQAPEQPAAAAGDAADSRADSSHDVDDLGFAQFSPWLLRQAQHTLMIQDRMSVLHLRRKALASGACASPENKHLCPEIFLDVVAEKLAYNAVLFINYELLQDFFFQFPRELDANLYYGKTLEQTRAFASQNPRIGQQLHLLERRQKLELVMARLRDLMQQQQQQQQQQQRGAAHNHRPRTAGPFAGP
ncbi:mitochondrial dynamin GTPase Msp1, partial [Coemansia spiralis]